MGRGSEDTIRDKAKQRGFHDEPRKRIRHSDAQRENYQRVFSIVSGLHRVIPGVDRLEERTNKAGHQNKRGSYAG